MAYLTGSSTGTPPTPTRQQQEQQQQEQQQEEEGGAGWLAHRDSGGAGAGTTADFDRSEGSSVGGFAAEGGGVPAAISGFLCGL